jgi:TonB family protein
MGITMHENRLATILMTAHLLVLSTSLSAQEIMLPCDEVEKEALEQVDADEVKLITSIEPAEPILRVDPKYPTRAAMRGGEGWVKISYVVDVDGNVQDPIVNDFGGHNDFKKAAVKALKKWQFSPAMQNGQPTEQCHQNIRFDFTMSNQSGASRKFIRAYKIAREVLEKDDLEEATKKIAELHEFEHPNRYENSWIWNIDSILAKKLGQQKRELNSINRSIASSIRQSKKYRTFDDRYFVYLYERKFRLEVVFTQFANALNTFEKIKTLPSSEKLQEGLQGYVDTINTIIASQDSIVVNTSIAKNGHRFHLLTRNAFGFEDVQGQLDTVEVRCEGKREKYSVAQEHIWKIPKSWGQCRVFVSGEPGTTFHLVEVSST